MTGQSTTPFMKLTDKKKKTVTFDPRDALERTSENMERMMVLMDKMYIKLDQKEVPYKPQIYQRGRGQNRQKVRQGNNWFLSRLIPIFPREQDLLLETILRILEDMKEEEVTFGEVTFVVDLIIVLVELGKIEGHGDHLG